MCIENPGSCAVSLPAIADVNQGRTNNLQCDGLIIAVIAAEETVPEKRTYSVMPLL